MNECINLLGDATLFSTLNANSRYRQKEAADGTRYKTDFFVQSQTIQIHASAIGRKDALGMFQQAMDIMLPSVI